MRSLAVDILAAGCGRPSEERHDPAIKVEIAIGDVVVRMGNSYLE
ncbi:MULTISPECIES: hypothetical protein [unclassified Bradyrhizobium]|nr:MULTISPECIES: hypothetical protein [unclassified Bradyrhizobium]WOH54853.1 hypothetical protein RX328_08335 [Bradyrhizobium sp. sBnM-33]